MSDLTELFGDEIISSYTRADGMADGFLVDVSETAREAGITFPVALTRAVWESCVEMTPAAVRACNDIQGRLWDVLWMLRCAIRRSSGMEILYSLKVVTRSVQAQWVDLKAVCGPGDTAEPVITVMLPDES